MQGGARFAGREFTGPAGDRRGVRGRGREGGREEGREGGRGPRAATLGRSRTGQGRPLFPPPSFSPHPKTSPISCRDDPHPSQAVSAGKHGPEHRWRLSLGCVKVPAFALRDGEQASPAGRRSVCERAAGEAVSGLELSASGDEERLVAEWAGLGAGKMTLSSLG